ncbi:pentapeptide repeat-containing protein [Vibrio splendidus]
MLTKKIETMIDQEVLALGMASRDRLYERVSDFFQSDKKVTRSVIYAMIMLRQRDLSCLSLIDLDLSNLNLQRMDFAGSTIKGCDFTGSDLSSATFEYAKVDNCIFHNALIIDTFLYSGKFKNNDFDMTDFFYARALPESFAKHNQNIHTGLPNLKLAINIDNDHDKELLAFCIIQLLVAKKASGLNTQNATVGFYSVCPYLTAKVNDQESESDFMTFFDQVHSIWKKFNYRQVDMSALGVEFGHHFLLGE